MKRKIKTLILIILFHFFIFFIIPPIPSNFLIPKNTLWYYISVGAILPILFSFVYIFYRLFSGLFNWSGLSTKNFISTTIYVLFFIYLSTYIHKKRQDIILAETGTIRNGIIVEFENIDFGKSRYYYKILGLDKTVFGMIDRNHRLYNEISGNSDTLDLLVSSKSNYYFKPLRIKPQ